MTNGCMLPRVTIIMGEREVVSHTMLLDDAVESVSGGSMRLQSVNEN
jgi:hypothetical protein